MFNREALASSTIANLARRDLRIVMILADAGVSPRYLNWTLDAAAHDLDIGLDALLDRIRTVIGRSASVAA